MNNFDVIYGFHPILEFIKARKRKLLKLYTTRPEPNNWSSLKKLVPAHVPIEYAPRTILTRIAGTDEHQGLVACVSPFGYRSLFFKPESAPLVLMLDGIQDPRNLGALLRSAYCVGIFGVIITTKHSSPLTATAYKASAGLAEHAQIWRASSAAQAITELKKAGYSLYVGGFGGTSLEESHFKFPACIIIGAEGAGASAHILKAAHIVSLTQQRPDISYNASVAGGILMYSIAHQLKQEKLA